MSEESKVEWQVGYYRLPESERRTVQDHTGELDFYDSENEAQEAAEKLQREGKSYDIDLTKLVDGCPVDSWGLWIINEEPNWFTRGNPYRFDDS